MADPLLYNALDAYLYSGTQLEAAQSQAATQEAIRSAQVPLLACCICCACLCAQELTNCAAGDGPGGVQEIIDQYSTCWYCYDCIPHNEGCPGWSTVCPLWPGGQGQCTASSIHCCNYTIPSNVNCVQFDLYGAGGNSWGSNCCGGSLYGATGAFATITMPVCSGWSYTMCVGCARCCYAGDYSQVGGWWGMTGGQRSCISGCGLCMYTMGGTSNQLTHMWQMLGYYGNWLQHCYGNRCAGSGVCWCNAGYFCHSGCGTCGRVPASLAIGGQAFVCYEIPTAITPAHSPKMFESEAVTVPGHFGSWCVDPGNCGDFLAPRVPRYHRNHSSSNGGTSPTMGNEGHLCMCFGNSNCCGGNCCSYGQGYMQWPGQGGMATMAQDGACRCGDMGRSGGVKVVYKTC